MTMPCDYHECAQCRPTPEGFTEEVFSATTRRSDYGSGGRVVRFHIHGVFNECEWTPDRAREIARRLLDAADLAEERDHKERVQ